MLCMTHIWCHEQMQKPDIKSSRLLYVWGLLVASISKLAHFKGKKKQSIKLKGYNKSCECKKIRLHGFRLNYTYLPKMASRPLSLLKTYHCPFPQDGKPQVQISTCHSLLESTLVKTMMSTKELLMNEKPWNKPNIMETLKDKCCYFHSIKQLISCN